MLPRTEEERGSCAGALRTALTLKAGVARGAWEAVAATVVGTGGARRDHAVPAA
jgi:hypothetical protein